MRKYSDLPLIRRIQIEIMTKYHFLSTIKANILKNHIIPSVGKDVRGQALMRGM